MPWIQIECNLWLHPKVIALTNRLKAPRIAVLGAVQVAWCLADQHAQKDRIETLSADDLDGLLELPGFCEAMQHVGWLQIAEDALIFPGYEERNGSTAKARSLAARRQQRFRTRHAEVTPDRDASVTRKEKRREEKKRQESLFENQPENVRKAIGDWLDYRRQSGHPYRDPERQIALLLKRFATAEEFVEAVEHSIAQGYQGCFPPSKGKTNGRSKKPAGPGQQYDPDWRDDPDAGKF